MNEKTNAVNFLFLKGDGIGEIQYNEVRDFVIFSIFSLAYDLQRLGVQFFICRCNNSDAGF